MDVQMSSAGDQQLKLQLRALNESQAESSRLKNLLELAALDPGRFCCRFITYILLSLQHDVSSSASAFDKLLCVCHVTHGMGNNCLLGLNTLNQRCPHFLLATSCFQSCCTHAYLRPATLSGCCGWLLQEQGVLQRMAGYFDTQAVTQLEAAACRQSSRDCNKAERLKSTRICSQQQWQQCYRTV